MGSELVTIFVIVQNILALFIAVLIYRTSKINNIYRVLFYLPVIFSSVTIGFMWSYMYDPNIGVLNTILSQMGLESWTHVWLSEKGVAILAIAAVHIWWGIGQGMVLFFWRACRTWTTVCSKAPALTAVIGLSAF